MAADVRIGQEEIETKRLADGKVRDMTKTDTAEPACDEYRLLVLRREDRSRGAFSRVRSNGV